MRYNSLISRAKNIHMKKFMVVYGAPAATMAEAMKNMTPEQRQKDMGEWKNWMEAHKADFVDMGGPLGKNTRVTKESVSDVPNEMGGYSIMQGESREAVVALLQNGPHFWAPGTYVEIMEVVSM